MEVKALRQLRVLVGPLDGRDLALIVCSSFVSVLTAKVVDAVLELVIWTFNALT
ncbi:hypothetical protein OG554_05500 [Streptomyces griseus]|uniref:hypothetical protein n=1 Tax=Streptomyces griseus TaxID=1911 RepID=UPI00386DD8C2|nr:hypothetical protein OG554_05500 [Streptomyces fimicarius]